jgi:D-alanine-D-alanine ligase
MKNIAVVFGGCSVEHDISILTGLHAAKHVEGYRVHLVYLGRDNKMMTGESLRDVNFYTRDSGKAKQCFFANGSLLIVGFLGRVRRVTISAILNCCHGGAGEGGALAGLADIANIPVTSCDIGCAQKIQSKTRTREILTSSGFAQPKYHSITKAEYDTNGDDLVKKILVDLGKKLIVKPDSLGSSIGISTATSVEELRSSLELAFEMDSNVIVEEFIDNAVEINCAALLSDGKVMISRCEEINRKHDVFDFENKYMDSGSGFIKKGKSRSHKNDEVESELHLQIQDLTLRAYKIFGASGVVRADFLVSNDKVYLNELNSVPGFLAYHLWARKRVPYCVVIDMLVREAINQRQGKKMLKTVFSSDILTKNSALIH